MKRLALAVAALTVLAACGGPSGRSQADQDRDGKLIASAIRAADTQGAGFDLNEVLVLSGGSIPSGQELRIHAKSEKGQLKGGAAQFTYRIQQGSGGHDYSMVLASGQLFVKASGASGWRATPVAATTSLFPALRLDLVRETVLLASSVSSSSLTHVQAGFAHKYVVRPAPDQLEQLQAIPVQGRGEATFLKTARAEVDVFLSLPGDRLDRIEVHLTGTDPSEGTKQKVDSSLDLRQAKVGAIRPPAQAVTVSPAEILT